MLRCRPRAVSARHAFLAASLLSILALIGIAAPALATPIGGNAPSLGAWPADTGAHALQAPEPAAGGGEAPNRSVSAGLPGLQQVGPAGLRQVTVDVTYPQDRPQPAYDVAAIQPLLRRWDRGDRLWLRGGFGHDPGGSTGGHLGLYYRPGVLDEDLTLALSGTVENYWLQDYRRYRVGTGAGSDAFELGTSLFDDVPDQQSARGGLPARRLDGYGIAVGARFPEVPWAWFRVKRDWQIPVDAVQPTTSDRLSLQLGPLLPLEVETGTTSDGERRSWFAQLRLRIPLG